MGCTNFQLPYRCCGGCVGHKGLWMYQESLVICGSPVSTYHSPCVEGRVVLPIRLNFSLAVFRTFRGKRRETYKDLLVRAAANHRRTGSLYSHYTFLSSHNHNRGTKRRPRNSCSPVQFSLRSPNILSNNYTGSDVSSAKGQST